MNQTIAVIERAFPGLKTSGYELKSPISFDYNCIAWAAGDTEAVWWPDSMNLYYWPSGVPRQESLDAFIRAFESLGYSPCDSSKKEPDYEKIAIFAMTGIPTHAARQLESGAWTSKLGQLHDIDHDLEAVTGDAYGSVAVIMKRRKLRVLQ